jgi:uncharacterized protein YrrD
LRVAPGEDATEVDELSGDALLALPVRLHGIELGRPVDVLLDREALRVVGVDVLCGDGVHRFLPLPTAAIADGALTIHSPLVLLEEDQLAFYRSRSFTRASMKRNIVMRKGRELGAIRDVIFGRDGRLLAVVIAGGERIPYDRSLAFAPGSRSAA